MRAVVLDSHGPANVMRLGEVPEPAPADDDVLIRVAATSVNRPDIMQREGRYPPPPGESEILGLELAGTIVGVGEKVSERGIGDRVFALVGGGGYAELAVAKAAHTLAIPDGMSFEQAACIAETYITAHSNLFGFAALRDGESVLLHGGGGGVATAAMQLVGALCPNSPIVVTASSAKLERVAALGADVVIDYRQDDFSRAARDFTDGRGIDVILDHIGAAYLDRNLRCLAVNGRLVVIGIMQGSDAELSLGRLMVKRQSIIGSVLRPRPTDEKTAIIDEFSRAVMPLFADGKIAPVIDRVFSIEDVVDAHRLMETGGHFGKIVLAIAP